MLYKFKVSINTDTISMKMDGDILGDTVSQARTRIKTALAGQMGVDESKIDVLSITPKRGR